MKVGIWTSIENRRKRKTRLRRWNGFDSFSWRMEVESKLGFRSSHLYFVPRPTSPGLVASALGRIFVPTTTAVRRTV